MNYAICYVSTAAQDLSDTQVEELLSQSQHDNNNINITGLLLYSEGNFFQVLEGEKQEILPLFETIKKDSRHFNIIKIFEKEVGTKEFDKYEVNFLSMDARVDKREISTYFTQIKGLDPSVQPSVKYILKQFTDGI